jgi:hypothetical protein
MLYLIYPQPYGSGLSVDVKYRFLPLTATRESTSLINAVIGNVRSDQNDLSGYAGQLRRSTQHSSNQLIP